jgi:hypothetical protein
VIVEDVGRWHDIRNLQAEPVQLLVIDLLPQGKVTNVVLARR